MENDTNKQQFSLEIKPEVAKGTYSNLAIITHSHSEFIIDFATILPGLHQQDRDDAGTCEKADVSIG